MNDGSDSNGDDEFIEDTDRDDPEYEDRLGVVQESVDGDDFVLTRVPEDKSQAQYEVLRFDRKQHVLRLFPKSTEHGQRVKQFERIREIQIESPGWNWQNHSDEHGLYDLLYARGLPKGFSAIYEFGLGVKRDYRGFVDGIQAQTKSNVVRFVMAGSEGEDAGGGLFRVSLRRFDDFCSAVDRSRSRGQVAVRRVIDSETHNAIADLFGQAVTEPKYTKNPVIRALTEEVSTGHVTDAGDRILLADELTAAAPVIAREAPERLVQLREDIELVSLEALIARFEEGLAGSHSRDEEHWQKFFNANHFALQLIFSTPIVVARQHATVQAADIDGRGSRITDFLCTNSVTRSAVVVEIKTPAAALMAPSSYRGKGTDSAVYPPHADLSGPISQVQSQMSSVSRSLAARLTPDVGLDPWNDPRGAVITGRISTLNAEQLESFLRYRAGLSTVTVLGYDEVLDRLKALHSALSSVPPEDSVTDGSENSSDTPEADKK